MQYATTLDEVLALRSENARLREALHKITAMATMPSHSVNTVTLVAARAIARNALGHEGTAMVPYRLET